MAATQIQFLNLVPLVTSYASGWTIRSLRSKDVNEVKKLNDRCLGSTIAKQFYLQFLYDSTAACVIVEDLEGQIIGCGTAKVIHRDLSSDDREGHILTLAVDPAFRRRGIGSEILEALMVQIQLICVRLSQQEGVKVVLKSIVLQANARNTIALRFYEECGYQRQSLQTGYYGRGKDAIPMRLSLLEEPPKTRVKREKIGNNSWVAVY